jgi:hypothetical protein
MAVVSMNLKKGESANLVYGRFPGIAVSAAIQLCLVDLL